VSHPLGETFFGELLWVHGMIRQDLETVRELAGRVAAGLGPDELGEQLDELEAAAAALGEDGRERVVDALNTLAGHLLAHLAFEEESIGPALRRMDRHPLLS
jgi:hypothetical protein